MAKKKRKEITTKDIDKLVFELNEIGKADLVKVKPDGTKETVEIKTSSKPVVVEKSKYTNEEFKQLLDEAEKNYRKRQELRQKDLEERLNKLTSKVQPETKALAKLQEEINKSLEPIKKIAEPMEKLQQELAKKTAVPINPFLNFMTNPANQGGLLGLAMSRGIRTRQGLMAKYKPNSTILSRATSTPRVRHKPDKEKREPSVIGMGVNSYMKRHKLVNPVEMAKAHTKNRDYKISGFIGLRQICEEMNVNVQEAFLYICEGMQSNDTRWRRHRIEKEFWRGSESVANIVRYYKDKNKEKQSKGQAKYSVKALHKSEYVKNIFNQNQAKVPSYSVFSQWFKDMKHHCEVLKLV